MAEVKTRIEANDRDTAKLNFVYQYVKDEMDAIQISSNPRLPLPETMPQFAISIQIPLPHPPLTVSSICPSDLLPRFLNVYGSLSRIIALARAAQTRRFGATPARPRAPASQRRPQGPATIRSMYPKVVPRIWGGRSLNQKNGDSGDSHGTVHSTREVELT
ncbi:hypothetical protein FA13DRAFT_707939 [Coprinellus micaceus]|uniref:Uncharacterized protein n=1 Tax=Coprinellus micaceus TaxID=71717 RepID=A0A4Y7TUD4_COPMI|nr:hypothetical protein FA13DRAFT_707939 [Coprinellus micaceus]